MLFKMVVNDFRGKRTITAAVFCLIVLSSLLMAAGARILVDLTASIQALVVQSAAPHFVQYHSGSLDKEVLAAWDDEKELIEDRQIVPMINVGEADLLFGSFGAGRADSVMEAAFVTQNHRFDFLLDMENRPLSLKPGEAALPVFYMQRYKLKPGDRLGVRSGDLSMEFTIVSALRDMQMNPSVVSSKRILVSDEDFSRMDGRIGQREYLIEYRLTDPSRVRQFADSYGKAKLPAKGPAIDQGIMKILNALTDGLIAGLVIFTSFVLSLVALLCLRFTILAAVEDDYREIGVLKALGLTAGRLRRLYLAKYSILVGAACLAGYGLSIPAGGLFLSNVLFYLGAAPATASRYAVPAAAAAAVYLLLTAMCALVLRRFKNISAVEALRLGRAGDGKRGLFSPALHRRRRLPVNAYLALAELTAKPASYLLLFGVFAAAAFITVVPANLLGTVRDPAFITYMGIGKSDILIDLRQSDDIRSRYGQVLKTLGQDETVERFSPLITCKYEVLNRDGYYENLTVETGDFSIFPLEYAEGRAPAGEGEIALSYLSAQDYGLFVGDSLVMRREGADHTMTVSGIYQDVTNGGRTAKAQIPPNYDTVAWFMIAVDLTPEGQAATPAKIAEYSASFSPARVTDVQGYVAQTFGSTVVQMERMTLAAQAAAFLVTVLITALFLKMMIAKERPQIAVQKALGFSCGDIAAQYRTRILAILLPALAAGTLAADAPGEALAGAALAVLGASRLEFVVDPLLVGLAYPSIFIALAMITTAAVTASVGRIDSTGLSVE